jgi:hypothetical protein
MMRYLGSRSALPRVWLALIVVLGLVALALARGNTSGTLLVAARENAATPTSSAPQILPAAGPTLDPFPPNPHANNRPGRAIPGEE